MTLNVGAPAGALVRGGGCVWNPDEPNTLVCPVVSRAGSEPGSSGSAEAEDRNDSDAGLIEDASSSEDAEVVPDPQVCGWRSVSNNVAAGGGGFGSSGVLGESLLERFSCEPDESAGPVWFRRVSVRAPVPESEPSPGVVVPVAPPSAEVLAVSAVGRLRVSAPVPHVGPVVDRVAVNTWTWLWVDEPEPVSVRVAAGGVSVVATATLTSTRWLTDEPGSAPVVCAGAGEPPALHETSPPDCGYVFRLRSTAERTGGRNTWALGVTATWSVVWSSNTGESGTDTLTSSSMLQVRVGQWRSVLVDPG